MPDFVVKPLDSSTWEAFAALVEKHNGIWGGCWCMGFREDPKKNPRPAEEKKCLKECRVREGRAHAALVFEGDVCVGWCQFGSAEELPRVKWEKDYLDGFERLPDWRITCFFVDSKRRGQGVASRALDGALQMIGEAGGGIVEACPEIGSRDTFHIRYAYHGSVEMFERRGFERARPLGKVSWLMTKTVELLA